VLAGFLLAPVIMLVQNSSVTMARDASNVNLRMSGRELLNIIHDDLRNTGFKLMNNFAANDTVSYLNPKFGNKAAQCNAATPPNSPSGCPPSRDSIREYDVSSLMPTNKVGGDNFYDALTVRMGKLTRTGTWDDIDTITYNVENMELKRTIQNKDNPNGQTITLAKNVEALKFRYSEDLVNWDDTFNPNVPNDIEAKNLVQYIKVILVTKDQKKLSPTKTTSITLIEPSAADAGLIFVRNDGQLYERHEIVIPIPNNGLFP
jgi:hypothetical protein